MLGEIFAYSVGKAVAKRKYKKSQDRGPAYCYGCANELGEDASECRYVYDYCTGCCNCTRHSV